MHGAVLSVIITIIHINEVKIYNHMTPILRKEAVLSIYSARPNRSMGAWGVERTPVVLH